MAALSKVFDEQTMTFIVRALVTKSEQKATDKKPAKLSLTDLVRASAESFGVDFVSANAWFVNVLVDEELLLKNEAIT